MTQIDSTYTSLAKAIHVVKLDVIKVWNIIHEEGPNKECVLLFIGEARKCSVQSNVAGGRVPGSRIQNKPVKTRMGC